MPKRGEVTDNPVQAPPICPRTAAIELDRLGGERTLTITAPDVRDAP